MSKFSFVMALVAFTVILPGCDSREKNVPKSPPTASTSSNLTLPATLEGVLVIAVEKGDAEDNTDIGFGTLTVGSKEYGVEVSGAVMRSAQIYGDEIFNQGRQVRATLGAKSEHSSDDYVITAIEKL